MNILAVAAAYNCDWVGEVKEVQVPSRESRSGEHLSKRKGVWRQCDPQLGYETLTLSIELDNPNLTKIVCFLYI